MSQARRGGEFNLSRARFELEPAASGAIQNGLAMVFGCGKIALMFTAALPQFHLYGDPPDDQAFDFIHIETIASRSSLHAWTIGAHRHRNLFQILLIERGGGEMVHETSRIEFTAPAVVLVAPTVAHGFGFLPRTTDGWVLSFTDDLVDTLGDKRSQALERLEALTSHAVVPLSDNTEMQWLSTLCAQLQEEALLAREGCRLAMRGFLALIVIRVMRLAASRARSGAVTLKAADRIVQVLRRLIDENFHTQRQLDFYAGKLNVTPDRLNDHVKKTIGVTAGQLIRQRVLTEAKRQLVFTNVSVHEIAYNLAFQDHSHFSRFFRQHTGTSPHEYRNGGFEYHY
jgi:AraC family transcriptional regulator, transcriptional activator of pobA